MSDLLSSMRSAAGALLTIQKTISVTENNVANASAPGYARQRLGLASVEFNPDSGMGGGLRSAGLISARDHYAESNVRSEVSLLSQAAETWTGLVEIETALNHNASGSIASQMDSFFAAATAWSVNPGHAGAKENVHAAAVDLAASFHRAASALDDARIHNERQIGVTLDEIGSIAERIRQFNASRRSGAEDAGLDAEVHNQLEKLAELIDFRAMWQEDGTVTVLAGGQSALVIGDRKFSLAADYTPVSGGNDGAAPPARILQDDGTEINGLIGGGRLAALLRIHNETLPGLAGDAHRQGELNRLAQAVADRVNSILAAGRPPEPPYHLFVYGSSTVSIAHTIEVNPALGAALLDATDTTSIPPLTNGKALQLGGLANPVDGADKLDDLSFTGYFGKISAGVGRATAAAKQERDARTQLAAQARNFRAELCGVSYDEEAVQLVQFQRAYQATARMITTLDELLEMAVNVGRG